jgi:repressor LexA
MTPPVTRPAGLTDRQRAILDLIRSEVRDRGYPPSIREIADAVGLVSPSSVAYQLAELARKGFLRRDPNRTRALTVLDAGAQRPCPQCAGTGRLDEPTGGPR